MRGMEPTTKKNPACEDRCQLLEHKGYITCALAGSCQWVEGFDAQQAQAIAASQRVSGYADAMSRRDRDSNDPHNWPAERPNQGGWLGHTFTIPEKP